MRAALALLFLALVLPSCGRAQTTVRTIPGPALPLHSDFRDVDLLVDEQGSYHVVWTCWYKAGSQSNLSLDHQEVWYQRGRNHGTDWDPPLRFRSLMTACPRIVRTGRRMHILYVGREPLPYGVIADVFSDDRGGTWSTPRPLFVPERLSVRSFDALALGDTLAIAYTLGAGRPDTLSMHCGFLLPNGAFVSSRLGTDSAYSFISPPRPRLVSGPGGLTALYPVNWTRNVRLRNEQASTTDAWIESFRTSDRGAHWIREERLVPEQRLSGGETSPLPITCIEPAPTNPPSLVIDAIELLRAQRDGAGWSRASVVLKRLGAAGVPDRTLATCTARGKAWLAWIDQRRQRHDLQFPLSDANPHWANNDVCVGMLPDDVRGGLVDAPRRLTPDLSYATSVAMQPDGNRLVVMWSGRERVGRWPTSANSPPRILWTTVPQP